MPRTVFRDAFDPRVSAGIIKITIAIDLKTRCVIMSARTGRALIIEVDVEVRFAIPITILQTRDLIFTQNVDLLVYNPQTQGLIQARGIPPPGHPFHFTIQPVHQPYITMHRTYGGSAILKKIDSA